MMNNLETRIFDLSLSIANELNITVVLIKIISTKNLVVQVFLENKDLTPIRVEQCSKLSKQLSVLLDVEEVINQRYKLEVSSLGINRPLFSIEDYSRFLNQDIKIITKTALDGIKTFRGKLISVSDEEVVVKLPNTDEEISKIMIKLQNIDKANLDLIKDFASNRGKNGK